MAGAGDHQRVVAAVPEGNDAVARGSVASRVDPTWGRATSRVRVRGHLLANVRT
jgi:hypothetical protein